MHTELGISCHPPAATVRLGGEFDLSTQTQLTDLFALAEVCGCHDLELDLSRVTFIDVGTLFLLDGQRRRVTAGGGSFVVVAESDCYRRLCAMAHYVVLAVDGQGDGWSRTLVPDERPRPRLRSVGRRPQPRPGARPSRS